MTLDDALRSPALVLLLRLEDDGFDLAVDGGGLRVKPVAKLSADRRDAIREHREALIMLVGHCLAVAEDSSDRQVQ